MIVNFKNLEIWKRSMKFVKKLYILTENFPNDERFGLVSQLRRAGVSVPANISEGCGRKTKKDFSRFLDIATGSICELETLVYLSYNLDYISEKDENTLISEITDIRRMIIGFQKSLQ